MTTMTLLGRKCMYLGREWTIVTVFPPTEKTPAQVVLVDDEMGKVLCAELPWIKLQPEAT